MAAAGITGAIVETRHGSRAQQGGVQAPSAYLNADTDIAQAPTGDASSIGVKHADRITAPAGRHTETVGKASDTTSSPSIRI
jgi:hypothetical protein